MESKKISMDIPVEMYDWLENHKNINRSEIFRQSVQDIIDKVEKKVSPVLYLLTIWANVGAIALLTVSIIDTPIPRLIRGVMAVFADIMSISAITVYVKVKREINE
jgi:hypothetical protein